MNKGDDSVRPVLDLRSLIKFVICPRNQVDDVSYLLTSYGGGKFFSNLDFSLAYFMVVKKKADRTLHFVLENINFNFNDSRLD